MTQPISTRQVVLEEERRRRALLVRNVFHAASSEEMAAALVAIHQAIAATNAIVPGGSSAFGIKDALHLVEEGIAEHLKHNLPGALELAKVLLREVPNYFEMTGTIARLLGPWLKSRHVVQDFFFGPLTDAARASRSTDELLASAVWVLEPEKIKVIFDRLGYRYTRNRGIYLRTP